MIFIVMIILIMALLISNIQARNKLTTDMASIEGQKRTRNRVSSVILSVLCEFIAGNHPTGFTYSDIGI